jgi:diguanylate cyclase (GGDEF)-like protein
VSPLGGKIAGAGLAVAAVAIAVLAALLYGDMSRDTSLLREIQAIQEVKGGLESLKDSLHRLRFAVSAHVREGDGAQAREAERETIAITAELEYLRAKAAEQPELAPVLAAMESPVRGYVDRAGIALRAPPGRRADFPWAEAEQDVSRSVQRAADVATDEINSKTSAQIRLWAGREVYVRALVAGTIAVLIGLGVAFRQAFQRARLDAARIEQLAHFDPLTGLANRSLLDDRLSRAVATARRNASPLAVLLFDLDGFKGVNDALGHAAGDALLTAVARRARDCVRDADTVGRLGGDEFLVLLPDTDRQGAGRVAGKILKAMAEPFEVGFGRVGISASIGGSFLPGPASDQESLVRAADMALYRAKREGRNRYCVPEGDEGAVPLDA